MDALRATVAALAGDARHTYTVLQGYKRRALEELEQVSCVCVCVCVCVFCLLLLQ
ncbi:MAG: hypothetical protein P4L40_19430 [Terracidiphilus sp.]|nr:hypothetical protein [Terracidiphilus sp.]